MLKIILQSFSFGELANYIGSEDLKSISELLQREITKLDLIEAVEVLIGFDFITQKHHRDLLISRMLSDIADSVLAKAIERIKTPKSVPESITDKYKLLQWIGDNYPNEFQAAMGFNENEKEIDAHSHGILAVEPHYPLHEYQQKIVSKVNALSAGMESRRCLIHLPTGAGKTRTAINIVCEHLRSNSKGLVLWLADTSELCSQAANEFNKAWSSLGNRTLKQYEYYSDTEISLGGIDSGFLVAGLQKINATKGSNASKILYDKLQNFVTLVVFDEAHKAIAPTYAKTVLDMLGIDNKAFFLGLSATPGRKLYSDNDEDKKLSDFFSNNKVTMKVSGYESPIKYLVEEGYLAKADFINIKYDGKKILHADGFSSPSHNADIRNALSEDDNRNIELLRVIKDEYSAGSSIIVFACSVEHSRSLAVMLSFEGIKAFSLDSKYDDPVSRRFKISEYSSGKVKVLINYNILTAGFDAPVTNVAIIARPTDSLVQYSQMAGRAMRGVKSKGNTNCRIYTVQDDIPAFTSVVHAFGHWDSLWMDV